MAVYQRFKRVALSLSDITGSAYARAACEARALLAGEDVEALRALADKSVDFYPEATHARQLRLLSEVGQSILSGELSSSSGATSRAFESATNAGRAPVSTFGLLRVGEDGVLRLITKSEHYHTPLGHGFSGYRLLEHARRLGIPNATHNNTRGHITRLLEEELIREANGLGHEQEELSRILRIQDPYVVNRVLNLETGSLAVEAALKMILARFYRMENESGAPKYLGRRPVFLVIGDDTGGLQANYHGTTILAQSMRGMWPDFYQAAQNQGLFSVCALRPNVFSDVEQVFERYERGGAKIAGFFHEIVMMNYGARLLSKEYLQCVYDLCREYDVPTVIDEIQSCLWAPDLFMFRELGLKPSFVAVGKGFSGGEYAASRVLFSAAMDCMPQFGALVTNGQEELASLSYLITMRWAKANREVTRSVGDYYEDGLRNLAQEQEDVVAGVEGRRHLCALRLRNVDMAKQLAAILQVLGLDVSAQSYKAECPPCVLTKIPLIADCDVVDFILEKMAEALVKLKRNSGESEGRVPS